MGLEELKKINLDPALVACYIRKFLDCLELLSLTAESVACHAGAQADKKDVQRLYEGLNRLREEKYYYQLSPRSILNFIVEHITYNELKSVYQMIQENYRIGRGIPKLVQPVKLPVNCAIHRQCLAATERLMEGDVRGFAKTAAGMFQWIHRMVRSECRRLGYLDAAEAVYDGSLLWK